MGARRGEVRIAVRALRRTPRFVTAALVALGLGVGAGAGLMVLVDAGLSHERPLESPAGLTLTEPGRGLGLEVRFSALERFFGAGAGLQEAARTAPELQREALSDLLRTLGLVAGLATAVAALNLAILLMIRGSGRRGELAIRAAVGATPGRLRRHLLMEGSVLAAIGISLGLIVAAIGVALIRRGWSTELNPWLAGPVPARAVAVVMAVLALVTLAASVIAAAGVGSAPLHPALGPGGRATEGIGGGALRKRFSTAAIAGSVVLLVGSGLLLRGFAPAAASTEAVFDPSDTLTLHLESRAGWGADPEARAEYYLALLERLAAVPGVRSEALSSTGAWMGLGTRDVAHALTLRPEMPGISRPARFHSVGPGFFSAIGAPVVRGREISADDLPGADPVAVVNEEFAHRLFPGLDPVGKKVQIGRVSLSGTFYTVVGVVPDIRVPGLGVGATPEPAVYLSALQMPSDQIAVALRMDGDPMDALPAVERVIGTMAPAHTLREALPMDERIRRFAEPLRWFGRLFGAAALVAIVLAASGVYGVISYSVSRRTREIGVRMALGARQREIVTMVVRETAALTATGGLVGLAGALCLGRLLQFLFHGVQPLDPVVYGVAAAVLGAVSLAAAYAPARAAARLDPVVALRNP